MLPVVYGVCLLVTTVSPTKTAELIEVPFGGGLLDSGRLKEPRVGWSPDSLREGSLGALRVVRRHAQACRRSIFSTVLTKQSTYTT